MSKQGPQLPEHEIFTTLLNAKKFNATGDQFPSRRIMDIKENKKGESPPLTAN
jgi:hypothetical protein